AGAENGCTHGAHREKIHRDWRQWLRDNSDGRTTRFEPRMQKEFEIVRSTAPVPAAKTRVATFQASRRENRYGMPHHAKLDRKPVRGPDRVSAREAIGNMPFR